METLQMPSTVPELGLRASKSAPVIVATDGRVQSDAALIVGGLLAESPGAIRLVTVLKPMPAIPDAAVSMSAELEAGRRSQIRDEVLDQATRLWGWEGDGELHDGDPATVIARVARRSGATMIVCGLGRHRVADRLFGDETALRLIRLADAPVLAVAKGLHQAPRRVLVAIDFSETSLRAARTALHIAARGAILYLAHVAPRDTSRRDVEQWGAAYKQRAADLLRRTSEELGAPRDMNVQHVLLQGDTATELLAFAASVNADLIAAGSHGYGFAARMLIGSVTTRIVRCSMCSVLVLPHAAAIRRNRPSVEPPAAKVHSHPDWRDVTLRIAHGVGQTRVTFGS